MLVAFAPNLHANSLCKRSSYQVSLSKARFKRRA